MYSRKTALSRARQYRTCPPSFIADDPDHQENMRQHRDVCPHCSGRIAEHIKAWETLAAALPKPGIRNEREFPKQEQILKGQLRHIRSGLGRWRGRYFYNPPLVLVLTDAEEFSEHVPAVQTYHDVYLAGPGDLILSGEQTGIGELFAECGNIYTVRAGDLDMSQGQVSSDIPEAIKKLAQFPQAYPDWALYPKPLTADDARIAFREIEAETASVFRRGRSSGSKL